MTVRVQVTDGVAEIALDRPDVLNSLDADTVAQFHQALDGTGAARAVLIRGEGRGFSAGRDLSGAEPLTEDATAILRTIARTSSSRLASGNTALTRPIAAAWFPSSRRPV